MFHPSDDDSEMVEEVERLSDRIRAADTDLRTIGLHTTSAAIVPWVPEPGAEIRPAVLVVATIGKLAFSKRVQHPDEGAIDHAAEEFNRSLIDFEYEERLREIKGG